MIYRFIFLSVVAFFLSSCTETEKTLVLKDATFNDLPGYKHDDFTKILPALEKSCAITLRNLDKSYLRGTAYRSNKDWQPFCKCILNLHDKTSQNIKKTIETHLIPYRALSSDGEEEGVFTGYYEPLLNGSLKKRGKYQTPLYKKPEGSFAYLPRSEIVKGRLNGKKLEIVYVNDPVEAFFLQIQGSGRVRLEDGKIIRLAYESGNKQPYTPIGKTLIEKGHLIKGKDVISMQTIKRWLKDHPHQAEEIMSTNRSYVFFKMSKDTDYAKGAQGVPLTPKRSLAIDPRHISYGTLLWVDIKDQMLNETLQHMMIAQDTGGAIKGPIRGDYFWGFGSKNGEKAGLMNAKGRYYLLLPKNRTSLK
jgi:membrane-bound lytic murein transglycosylase A